MTTPYTLTVNGTHRQVVDAWLGESLLYVLRERLGLPGSKAGCEQGECGSCSVIIDGALECACLVLAAAAVGRDITTVEGLQPDRGGFTAVQEAFLTEGAVQCGFCTPGLIVALDDLLGCTIRIRATSRSVEADLRQPVVPVHRVRPDPRPPPDPPPPHCPARQPAPRHPRGTAWQRGLDAAPRTWCPMKPTSASPGSGRGRSVIRTPGRPDGEPEGAGRVRLHRGPVVRGDAVGRGRCESPHPAARVVADRRICRPGASPACAPSSPQTTSPGRVATGSSTATSRCSPSTSCATPVSRSPPSPRTIPTPRAGPARPSSSTTRCSTPLLDPGGPAGHGAAHPPPTATLSAT